MYSPTKILTLYHKSQWILFLLLFASVVEGGAGEQNRSVRYWIISRTGNRLMQALWSSFSESSSCFDDETATTSIYIHRTSIQSHLHSIHY